MLVTYDEQVVGEVLPVFGGYVYKHYRFNMRNSSACKTLNELVINIDKFLKGLYE